MSGVVTSVGNTTSFGTFASAALAAALTDETGSGSVVFSTSPTLVTPALGTPTSGVLTNCTGTASGLTAGNVTTNANLTGVVTSVGNATSFAGIAAYSYLGNSTSGSAAPIANTALTLGTPGFTPTAGTIAGQITSTIANYYEFVVQNLSVNSAASADLVVTADNGTDSTHYGDFGINSSLGGAAPFTGANAVYLYALDNELDLAALGSTGVINFYTTGGTSAPVRAGYFDANQKLNLLGATVHSFTPTASTPSITITGAPYTAGNGTTNTPVLYLNSGASGPTTLSTAGTAIGINLPSGSTSVFMDCRINGGASLFNVQSTGIANGVELQAVTSGGVVNARLYSASNGGLQLNQGSVQLFSNSTSNVTFVNASLTLSQSAGSSGSPTAFTVTGAAHTNLATTAEDIGVNLNLSATKTWVAGTVATQREVLVQAPTYTCGSAMTITKAASFAINGAPTAAGSVTITNTYALWVQAGQARFDGSVACGLTLSVSGHTTFEGVTSTGATGTGKLVYDTAPTLGVVTLTSVNKVAVTAPATSATLTIADGKTLTMSNTLTFTGTDSSSVACGAGGTVAYLGTVQAFSKQQTLTPQALTSTAASIAWDANNGNNAKHTATENTTLANPTNLVDGTVYTFKWKQHASAAKTLAFGSKWAFGSGSSTVSSTVGSVQVFTGIYDSTDDKIYTIMTGPF